MQVPLSSPPPLLRLGLGLGDWLGDGEVLGEGFGDGEVLTDGDGSGEGDMLTEGEGSGEGELLAVGVGVGQIVSVPGMQRICPVSGAPSGSIAPFEEDVTP